MTYCIFENVHISFHLTRKVNTTLTYLVKNRIVLSTILLKWLTIPYHMLFNYGSRKDISISGIPLPYLLYLAWENKEVTKNFILYVQGFKYMYIECARAESTCILKIDLSRIPF